MKNLEFESAIQRKISNVNWNQVYYFSVVATYGSIKKTSEILKLSSSTLSEHISQLENSLGVTLFYRSGPKMTLTENGEKLAWQAKQMFENGQRIIENTSTSILGVNPISVGVVPGPHLPVAHNFLTNFIKRWGPINLKVSQWSFDELEISLARGNLNFGFADQAAERKDVSSCLISSSRIKFYVSGKWNSYRLKEVLAKIPLLICQSEASTDAFLQKALSDAKIEPCGVIKAEYPSILLDLCRKGLGVGAFSEGSIDPYKAGSFHLLSTPKETLKIDSDTYLLWATNGENTLAVKHAKEILDHCNEI